MKRLVRGRIEVIKSSVPACKPLSHERKWPKGYYEKYLLPVFESFRSKILGRWFCPTDLFDYTVCTLGNRLAKVALTPKPSKEDSYRDSIGKPRVRGKSITRLMQKVQRYLQNQMEAGTVIHNEETGQWKFVISRRYSEKGDKLVS